MVDFIGVGAQKSGTSWVHACLYEHPEICSPVKELHFFSRERFNKGREWYESHFKNCTIGSKTGEFSTSYLYSSDTPARIHDLYPKVKLIAIVRQPAERAYSQYRNAIKAGEISEEIDFATYATRAQGCLAQGLYAEQLERYVELFSREQLLVMVYEDIKSNPKQFIQKIYAHIGVDDTFVPPSLNTEINVARTPKTVAVDKGMHGTAEWLRKVGLDKLVYAIRRTGLPELVRRFNTKTLSKMGTKPDLSAYNEYFIEDAKSLGELINRDLVRFWKL